MDRQPEHNLLEEFHACLRAMMCCESCGIAAIDDVKLKDCDNCDLVKYCSEKCQGNHRNSTRKSARSALLNCVTEIYLRSPMKAIWVTVRFVFCHCPLKEQNLSSCNAAAN